MEILHVQIDTGGVLVACKSRKHTWFVCLVGGLDGFLPDGLANTVYQVAVDGSFFETLIRGPCKGPEYIAALHNRGETGADGFIEVMQGLCQLIL